MFNFALFKQSIKSNYKFVLIFFGILTMYITIIVSMYDPEALKIMEELAKTMPEMMAMMGMSGNSATLMNFLITYLYGFLFLIIPLIITVVVANRLVASHVDKGSMAYLLSSPNSRFSIIFTQIKALATIIFIVIAYCTLVTIVSCVLMFPGKLEIGKLLIINIGLLAFHLFLGGISFLASTIANETKQSLMFGAGLPLLFFLIQMLANMEGKLENLKYLTIFTLFQPLNILKGEFLPIIFMFIGAFILYYISIIVFKKKDLSV